jgi:hypothetical protein
MHILVTQPKNYARTIGSLTDFLGSSAIFDVRLSSCSKFNSQVPDQCRSCSIWFGEEKMTVSSRGHVLTYPDFDIEKGVVAKWLLRLTRNQFPSGA